MKLSEEQYDIIEAYLTNELSANDRASFEGDIQSDAELRAEVERQRNLRLGLRALGIERALANAKAQYQATASPGTESATVRPLVQRLTTWRYWAAAASVVMLLGVGYYLFRQQVAQRDEMAYAESFGTASSDLVMKDFPTNAFSLAARPRLLDAFRNYEAGKYDRVIDQLKTLPTDKQTIYYKDYFLGLTYLANRQPAEAVPLLDSARMAPGLALRQKATWFLSLAYVKDGQKDKALPMLKQISTDKANPFNVLAQRVLQKIN